MTVGPTLHFLQVGTRVLDLGAVVLIELDVLVETNRAPVPGVRVWFGKGLSTDFVGAEAAALRAAFDGTNPLVDVCGDNLLGVMNLPLPEPAAGR